MIVRATLMLLTACLCLTPGEADARRKSRPKRVAALDLSRLAVPVDPQNVRAARWMAGDPGEYDDGSKVDGIRWRLRGAGVKVRMPIAFPY